jgi:hypothetical protein
MIVIEAGHVYEVANVDGHGTQRIEFVRRRDHNGEMRPEELRREGILSQELLRVLIDRTLYLNAENPCREDVEIVDRLRDVLRAYEARASRRSIEKLSMPERHEGCPVCHHLLCFHTDDEKEAAARG